MHLAPPLPQNLLAPWLQRAASSPSLLALAAEHFLLQGFKGALARAISLVPMARLPWGCCQQLNKAPSSRYLARTDFTRFRKEIGKRRHERREGVGECVAVALPGPTVTVAVPGIITTQSHLVPEGCNSNKEYPGCTGEDTSGAYSGAIHLRATYLGYWSCQIGCASSRLHCAGDTERLMLFVFAFLDSVKHDRDISESFPEDAWNPLLAKLSESLPPVVVLSAGCRFCHHHQN